jgi:hypothetical protein
MDLYKAIQDLYAEKEKLERVIASLEELQRTAGELPEVPKPAKRRGRKSMNAEERQEVSERMKRYWESRRLKGAQEAKPPEEPHTADV